MTGDEIVAKARSYIGVVTSYSMDAALQGEHCTDCSGFVWRVFGRHKCQDGRWWNTAVIYADASGEQKQFTRLDAAEPGCLVVYDAAHNGGHTGHVSFVADPETHQIIDCSGSHNGVHIHDGGYFWHHPGALFCRYHGATDGIENQGS